MGRLNKYLTVGMVLMAGYTANMGYRMSNVADVSELLGRWKTARGLREVLTSDGFTRAEVESHIENEIDNCEDTIASERRKAFFVLDWPNLF